MHEITKQCRQCQSHFTTSDRNLAYIQKVSPVIQEEVAPISLPTLCAECRLQRRLAHRNERHLYERTCDLTGKHIVSVYSQDAPFTIYDTEAWWGDNWNALDYAKDFDFSKTFFEQFQELQKVVPRMGVLQSKTENSTYTNCVSSLRNCYLLFSSDFDQDCCYGTWVTHCRDCIDNLMIQECECTYESVFSNELYNCNFVVFSSQCRDSSFLFDCRNCSDCLMCWGLRNKQYCIANWQYTKEEYFQKLQEFPLSSAKNLARCKYQFTSIVQRAIHLYIWKKGRVVNSTGDFLSNVENCQACFDLISGKDCTHCLGYDINDAMDCTYVMGERGYENCECFPMPFRSAFNLNSYTGHDLYYCDLCMNSCNNLFGCIGLKNKQYCILNKQYDKEEYEELLPRIIAHMRETGEWGEFFPINLSVYSYNETNAQEQFPLTENDMDERGWAWKDIGDDSRSSSSDNIPDDIADVSQDILKKALICTHCYKQYRFTKQELLFYKKRGISLPSLCFSCRHMSRMAYKNPRKLWQRQCARCRGNIETTYAPDRPEVVYCEPCYLQEIHGSSQQDMPAMPN